jgi:YgiT-type zinc finger domain-containing protein
MKCVICKLGETKAGTTTLTFVRSFPGLSNEMTIILKGVPAQVCSNCGEAYLDESTSAEALRIAEQAFRAGTSVEIREFRPTANA